MWRLHFLQNSHDYDDVFVFFENCFDFSATQQYIQSDRTDELNRQILNMTSFSNAKVKILSQFSPVGMFIR